MAFEPNDLPEGALREFYAYWSSKRQGQALPMWNDVHLADLETLVPHITVFDIDLEKRDAQIRFVGTHIIESQGSDTTGHLLSEMENMEPVLNRCLGVADTHEPYLIVDQPLVWSSKDFKIYSTLGLPLCNHEGIVDKVIYLMTFA